MIVKVKFEKDYGVDIGILIDLYKLGVRIREVSIGNIENDSQDWKNLIGMSRQVTSAIVKRAFQLKSENEVIKNEINNLRILMDHPGGGSAQSVSYKPQKRIEILESGSKPKILFKLKKWLLFNIAILF